MTVSQKNETRAREPELLLVTRKASETKMVSDYRFMKNIEKLADSFIWFLINKIVVRMNRFVNRPWNNHVFYRIHAIVLSPPRQSYWDWLILYSNAAIKSRSRRMLLVLCSPSLAQCSGCKSPWNGEQVGESRADELSSIPRHYRIMFFSRFSTEQQCVLADSSWCRGQMIRF